jgi:hypothetical protein
MEWSRVILVVATASLVVLIDVEGDSTREVSGQGGDRMTLSPDWVAGSKGSTLSATAIAALK